MNVEDMKSKINSKTKAIMPVHLTGRMCEMDRIIRIAKKNKSKSCGRLCSINWFNL